MTDKYKYVYMKSLKVPKGLIRIFKSNNRQCNGQKDKQRSTKRTYKTKDLKTGGELGCSGRVAVPVSLVALVVLI